MTTAPRPGSLAAIWGHERAIDTLRRAVRSDRVAHSYLFAGPDGVGKQAVALSLASSLLCLDRDRPDRSAACRDCSACRRVLRLTHPDVELYNLAGQAEASERAGGRNTGITIETVRRLRAATALRPMEGARRFLIVDDAETMQETAQEALLKTLEEPPSSVVLMLLASDAEALLPTIRSRCQIVEFGLVETGTIESGLRASGAEPVAAGEIAGLAQGRPGWAVRAASDPRLLRERRAAVERAIAWVEGTRYERLVAAVRLGDVFSKRRNETFVEIETVLGVWRDLLLARLALPDRLAFREQVERIAAMARNWEPATILGAIASVQTCLADLEANVRPRLAIEAMVLAWPTPSSRR